MKHVFLFIILISVKSIFGQAPGRVKIQNNTVVTADGKILRSAPFFMSVWSIDDIRKNETLFKDYFKTVPLQNGMNCVRVSPWIGNWEYDIQNNNWHKNQYLLMMDKCVQWAEEAGIYAVINMHIKWNTKVDIAKTKAFWDIVAPRYKDKTHVVYEILNEPDLITLKTNMEQLYTHVRALAPDTHLICWSTADAGTLGQANPDDNTKQNYFDISYLTGAPAINYSNASVGWHYYPWNVNGDMRRINKIKEYQAAGYPVINTELMSFANADNFPIDYSYLKNLIKQLEDAGISWMQWAPRFNYRAFHNSSLDANGNLITVTSSTSTSVKNAIASNVGPETVAFQPIYKTELTSNGLGYMFPEATPLAIVLKNFSVTTANSNAAQVQWNLINDLSTLFFTIERSTNGTEFTEIATISNLGQESFSFLDKNAVKGANYYRLKWREESGSVKYSIVKSLFLLNESYFLNLTGNYNGLPIIETNMDTELMQVFSAHGQQVPSKWTAIAKDKYILEPMAIKGQLFIISNKMLGTSSLKVKID
jgi:hypothetical protein